jgi:PD-(D/E)XK nuclease superfamily/Domain of unknown function (DUF2357)
MRTVVLRRAGGGDVTPLEPIGNGWACSEGDCLVLEVFSAGLPTLRMAGRDVPMRHIALTEGGYSTRFELLIDTWAGRTTLFVRDGIESDALLLEIGPHEKKLGQNAFDAMLAELTERSKILAWGLSPGAVRGSVSNYAPVVVHPAIIESQLPLLERLLTRLIADPPALTVRSRECRPLDLSRRADLRTLRSVSKNPELVACMLGTRDIEQTVNPRTVIDQPVPYISLDHPVTRYIAFLLQRVLARLRSTGTTLRDAHVTRFRDAEAEAHAAELAERVDVAAMRIDRLLRAPLFRQLRPEPMSDTVLQSLADHPLYSAVHRVAQRLLLPGLAYTPNGDLYASLKRTYDLFELFVLYRALETVTRILGPTWQGKQAATLGGSEIEERPMDRALWLFEGPDGLSLELRYQQWFDRAQDPPDTRRFSSLSGLNIPDYILVLRRHMQPISWLILDAKYRSGRHAVDQGLGDVHRYRDALRVEGLVAAGAYIIVPRLQETQAPYGREEFHTAHRFGVLQIYSDEWRKPIERWIGDCLYSPARSRAH